jgi:hypothetical protein
MIISCEQIKRRLAELNVRVGDVHFDPAWSSIEIFGRADNKAPGKYAMVGPVDVDMLIRAAAAYFHGLELADVHVLDDGRKVPA